jgi:hypothetical protein
MPEVAGHLGASQTTRQMCERLIIQYTKSMTKKISTNIN